jgi:cell pole-organizing protein PopZ
MAENEKDPTIGVDEVYSLHLVRELKVVVVQHGGEKFEIPVNSTAKFALVNSGTSTASKFESVDALINAKHLPKVVVVCSDNIYPVGMVALHKDEVLIVREVVKTKLGRKSALRVYSVLSCREFDIPKDCDAVFSTDPEATKLYLSDLLDSGINFLPCSGYIFPDKNSALAALRSSIIRIESQEVHRSVVISLFRNNPNAKRKTDTNFIDIPTTIGIRVSVIETDKSDEVYERIYKQSEDLLTKYNPSKIQACVDAHTDEQYMTQAQLLAEIRREKAKSEMMSSAPQQYQKLLVKATDQSSTYQPWATPAPAPQQYQKLQVKATTGQNSSYQPWTAPATPGTTPGTSPAKEATRKVSGTTMMLLKYMLLGSDMHVYGMQEF